MKQRYQDRHFPDDPIGYQFDGNGFGDGTYEFRSRDGNGRGDAGDKITGRGWGDALGDGNDWFTYAENASMLRGPDMLSTCVTVREFESATGSVTRVTECSAASAVGVTKHESAATGE